LLVTYDDPRNRVLDEGTCGRHLANMTEQSVFGGNMGSYYYYCSNLLRIDSVTLCVT